eukprot:TRINITY_DN3335_c0_g3_i2.p1 TRINITY_DN3335_c0_g3~~TRINITY_DN3335_c0_g3_i2.p1  ORF type:complete len:244 (+),score=45.80 TRINITY_DN3335_c0_g3_i2:53-733(+)
MAPEGCQHAPAHSCAEVDASSTTPVDTTVEELFTALMVALERRKTSVDAAAAKLEAEKAEWLELCGSVQRTVTETPLELNVGGTRFQTSAETLSSVEGSFFDGMMSGRANVSHCKDGSFFIDRPAQVFEHVLNFMRGVELHYELLSDMELVLLRTEAHFYRLDALVTAIDQAMEPADHAPAAAAAAPVTTPDSVEYMAAVVEEPVDEPAAATSDWGPNISASAADW